MRFERFLELAAINVINIVNYLVSVNWHFFLLLDRDWIFILVKITPGFRGLYPVFQSTIINHRTCHHPIPYIFY
jgi:hypothetical protein